MAQRVEVAIVFKEILGAEEAVLYMAKNGISQHVADLVLEGMTTMRASDGAIVGYCQHDLDLPPRTAAKSEHAPASQERAVAPPIAHAATSNAKSLCSRQSGV